MIRFLKGKDIKSWRSYRRWYIWKDWSWVILEDCNFPFKRNNSIDKDINHGSCTNQSFVRL